MAPSPCIQFWQIIAFGEKVRVCWPRRMMSLSGLLNEHRGGARCHKAVCQTTTINYPIISESVILRLRIGRLGKRVVSLLVNRDSRIGVSQSCGTPRLGWLYGFELSREHSGLPRLYYYIPPPSNRLTAGLDKPPTTRLDSTRPDS